MGHADPFRRQDKTLLTHKRLSTRLSCAMLRNMDWTSGDSKQTSNQLTDTERLNRLRLIRSDNVGPRGIMAQTPQGHAPNTVHLKGMDDAWANQNYCAGRNS
ncbi:hypothetical protein [Bradyrhizobium sp. USDA 4452]